MRVAVRVDAGPLMGGGHAMRCLTLADALQAQGAEVTLVAAMMPDWVAERVEASGQHLIRIPTAEDLDREGVDWHARPLDGHQQGSDALATAESVGAVDWLIVDHYLLNERWHSAARAFAQRILVIDDLANRSYDCDLLLDQTFGRSPAAYEGRVPPAASVLTGAVYALLRPEFTREREAALARRRDPVASPRILISMGTTDLRGCTARVVDEVLSAATDHEIDVVLGPDAASLGQVSKVAERSPRLRLHIAPSDMARLMREADVAIGAGGGTSLERCCLGLPSIAVLLAENQRSSTEALARSDALVITDSVAGVGVPLADLLAAPDRRAQMSAAAFAIVDGKGIERVVTAMLGRQRSHQQSIALRPASVDDAELLWLWRNDPETRQQSRDTAPISWRSHMRWLDMALSDSGRRIMMAVRDGKPVGNIGLHRLPSGGCEASITIAPEMRGTGLGRTLLSSACADEMDDTYAAIRTGNEASRRLFESCGFEPVESEEPGFVRYKRGCGDRPRKQA